MIELIDIVKTYSPGGEIVHALDGVSLTIHQGEFVAIMGASGSGKSTLMQILGLLDKPTSGQYKLFGRDVATLDENTLASLRSRHFGFVFQQFFLLPKMTAYENAALPLLYAGNPNEEHRAQKALEAVGLASRVGHRPNQMSGGQQQRVAIARALVNNPEIIFADEPTGNLDSHTKLEIMDQLKKLNESGKTVILVTHEEEMSKYAKRVITMRDGRVTADDIHAGRKKSSKDSQVPVAPLAMSGHKHLKEESIRFWDYVKQAFFSIFSHKTRSFLSVLGILIGVGAVIAMLSLGEGASESMKAQLSSLGSNMLVVRPGTSNVGAVAQASGTTTRLTVADAQAIAHQVDTLDGVSGAVNGHVQVLANGKNANTTLEGVETDYEKIRNSTPVAGRYFTAAEAQSGAKVALLGRTVVKELFGNNDPLGQTIRLNSTYFKVIGILPVRGANTFRDQDDVVDIPLKTAMKRVLNKDYVDMIYVNVVNPKDVDSTQDRLTQVLSKRHPRVATTGEQFEVRNMSDIKNTLSSMTTTMSGLLGIVATISLVVGGIGIMNIMLVAVVERTKEIGLRKAVGATRQDILYQFLFEAVILSLIGGLLGVALGAGISILMAVVLGWAVSVSLFAVFLSTTFSFLVGLVFGLWPAFKASDLSPIVALRYE